MIRITNSAFYAVALLPLAAILLTLGIYLLNTSEKRGVWLKIALIINSSLVLALGLIGCGGSANGDSGDIDEDEMVTCYMVPPADITQIPQNFEDSSDWYSLENSLITYEYIINSDDADEAKADELFESMLLNVTNLRTQNLINDDDAQLLTSYLRSRDKEFKTTKCGVKCYMVSEPKGIKAQTEVEIISIIGNLKALYANGDIESEAYNLTLQTLEDKLKLYTGKEENEVLRQLLLDIVDGRSGQYFRDGN